MLYPEEPTWQSIDPATFAYSLYTNSCLPLRAFLDMISLLIFTS